MIVRMALFMIQTYFISSTLMPYYKHGIKWADLPFCIMFYFLPAPSFSLSLRCCFGEDETIIVIHTWFAQRINYVGSYLLVPWITYTLTQSAIGCQARCLILAAPAVLDFSITIFIHIHTSANSQFAPHAGGEALSFRLGALCGHDCDWSDAEDATRFTCVFTARDWANLGWPQNERWIDSFHRHRYDISLSRLKSKLLVGLSVHYTCWLSKI